MPIAKKKTAGNGSKSKTTRAGSVKDSPVATAPVEVVSASTDPAPTREQIAERAYLIWQQRGGSPEENWAEAERQLRAGA